VTLNKVIAGALCTVSGCESTGLTVNSRMMIGTAMSLNVDGNTAATDAVYVCPSAKTFTKKEDCKNFFFVNPVMSNTFVLKSRNNIQLTKSKLLGVHLMINDVSSTTAEAANRC